MHTIIAPFVRDKEKTNLETRGWDACPGLVPAALRHTRNSVEPFKTSLTGLGCLKLRVLEDSKTLARARASLDTANIPPRTKHSRPHSGPGQSAFVRARLSGHCPVTPVPDLAVAARRTSSTCRCSVYCDGAAFVDCRSPRATKLTLSRVLISRVGSIQIMTHTLAVKGLTESKPASAASDARPRSLS